MIDENTENQIEENNDLEKNENADIEQTVSEETSEARDNPVMYLL